MDNKLPSFDDLEKMQKAKGLPAFEDLHPPQKDEEEIKVDVAIVPEKPPKPKPPKKAAKMDEFFKDFGQGHAMFFRYIRRFEEDSFTNHPIAPKGGACILVDMMNDEEFVFSFAVCSKEDNFSKDEARYISQQRFISGETIEVCNFDSGVSCYHNIHAALEDYFSTAEGPNPPEGPYVSRVGYGVSDDRLLSLYREIRDYY